nr:hypothetical protein [uncultured Oscillibacter sp.]
MKALSAKVKNIMICMADLLVFLRSPPPAQQFSRSGILPNRREFVDLFLVKGQKFCLPDAPPRFKNKNFTFSLAQSSKIPKNFNLYFS